MKIVLHLKGGVAYHQHLMVVVPWVSGAVSGHRDGDQGTRRRKGWAAILPVNTCVKTCQGANRSG